MQRRPRTIASRLPPPGGRAALRRDRNRCPRSRDRRSRVQYGDDRLPGDPHRSFLRRTTRGHDLPSDRQLRNECRGCRVGAAPGVRLHRQGSGETAQLVAEPHYAGELSCRTRCGGHPGRGYEGAHSPHPQQGSHARRNRRDRNAGRGAAAARPGPSAHGGLGAGVRCVDQRQVCRPSCGKRRGVPCSRLRLRGEVQFTAPPLRTGVPRDGTTGAGRNR